MNRLKTILIFVSLFILCSCSSSRISFNKIKDKEKCYFVLRNTNAYMDSVKDGILANQTESIVRSLLEKINSGNVNKDDSEIVVVDINVYEKSYFSDTSMVHSLYIQCSCFDGNGERAAEFSEFTSGKETLNSPVVLEKYLGRTFARLR